MGGQAGLGWATIIVKWAFLRDKEVSLVRGCSQSWEAWKGIHIGYEGIYLAMGIDAGHRQAWKSTKVGRVLWIK